MNSFVASKVALVAESSLAAVALVRLVAVHLKHVLLQRFILSKLGVAFVAEEGSIFCSGETNLNSFSDGPVWSELNSEPKQEIPKLCMDLTVSPQLESEYSECSSVISSARRDLEVLGQTSECCEDGVPQVEQFRRLE